MSDLRSPRAQLVPEHRAILARHAKLRFDKARDRWILLVPEKVMVPDDICVEILRMCDGVASIAAITGTMEQKYTAPPGVIAAEVLSLLQDLADKGFVIPAPEAA